MTIDDHTNRTSNGRTVVMFGRSGCAPCLASEPIWIAGADALGVAFVKVDCDLDPELASAHHIRSVPVVLLYEDGVVVDIVHGATRRTTIEAKLDRWR